MRSKFDEQLDIFANRLIKMGSMCESMLKDVNDMLNTGEEKISLESCSEKEYDIFKLGREVENMGMELLLRQQPVATDLRTISSAFKIVYDFRRISTQIVEIREILSIIEDKYTLMETDLIPMSNAVMEQMKKGLDSLVTRNETLTLEVIEDDDIVDSYFDKVKFQLIDAMEKDRSKGEDYINLLMAAKYFEKIGDHAVNIGETQYFAITGRKAP